MKKPDPTKASLSYIKREAKHIKEIVELNQAHSRELREAEKGRLDAIRGVDMKAVEVLAGNVEGTRIALASQSKESEEKLSARITFLENNQSQNQGKSSFWSNPIILILISAVVGFILAKYLK